MVAGVYSPDPKHGPPRLMVSLIRNVINTLLEVASEVLPLYVKDAISVGATDQVVTGVSSLILLYYVAGRLAEQL